jgi:shikimate dehydrogenase
VPPISARTRVAAVIGDPVHHSLSPVLHNAAYQALELDWVYVALPVAAGRFGAAIEAMRTFGLVGLSVTMPHKTAAAAGADALSPTAARLGSVNTLTRHGDRVHGESTDGPGLIDALRAEHSWHPEGRECAVLGTGGAARAVVLALAEAGAAKVAVLGRRPDAAAQCAALAGTAGLVGTAADVARAALVVNATPVGMTGVRDAVPFELDAGSFGKGQLVVDLVYAPSQTALMGLAAAAGASVGNGLGMLIHQAARQIALWTGLGAPVEVMRTAALAALDGPAAP